MRTITIEQANNDLIGHINYTLDTHDEVNIASNHGSIVMIPQIDYESMQETLRLLSDKKSLKALLDGHSARDSNHHLKSYTIEEVFGDL